MSANTTFATAATAATAPRRSRGSDAAPSSRPFHAPPGPRRDPDTITIGVASPRSRPDLYLRILKLLLKGWNNSAIARAVGCDRETVRHYNNLVHHQLDAQAAEQGHDWAGFEGQISATETTGDCFAQRRAPEAAAPPSPPSSPKSRRVPAASSAGIFSATSRGKVAERLPAPS